MTTSATPWPVLRPQVRGQGAVQDSSGPLLSIGAQLLPANVVFAYIEGVQAPVTGTPLGYLRPAGRDRLASTAAQNDA